METPQNLSLTKVEDGESETEITFHPNAQHFSVEMVQRLMQIFGTAPLTTAQLRKLFARHSRATRKRLSPKLSTVEEEEEEEEEVKEERLSPNLKAGNKKEEEKVKGERLSKAGSEKEEEKVKGERLSANLIGDEEDEERENVKGECLSANLTGNEGGEKEKVKGGEDSKESISKAIKSTLNPCAEPWYPIRASMDERTLFVCFSHGISPTEDQIKDYFNSHYGVIVEYVQLYRPRKKEADIGKIVFKNLFVTPEVLKHEDSIKLYMAGKPFWLKKYQPRHPCPCDDISEL